MNIFRSIQNLTKAEKGLWLGSLMIIFISSALLPDPDWLSVITSLVGATALIFVGKGDPIGQLISIIFGVLYAIVSWHFRYYGEMVTYLCMTSPSAAWALYTWLKHPYSKVEVRVANMNVLKWLALFISSIAITVVMYFVLGFFGTANLIVSTVSVTTSFMASMLTVLRSPYYALFYAMNDIVLIVLWVLAAIVNIGYLPMLICFIVFLINDIYGFVNWRKMRTKQSVRSKI